MKKGKSRETSSPDWCSSLTPCTTSELVGMLLQTKTYLFPRNLSWLSRIGFRQLLLLPQLVQQDLANHVASLIDFRVGSAIKNAGAFLPRLNDAPLPQKSQVLREIRLTGTQHLGEFVHSSFSIPQGMQNSQTNRMSKRLRDFSLQLVYCHVYLCVFRQGLFLRIF